MKGKGKAKQKTKKAAAVPGRLHEILIFCRGLARSGGEIAMSYFGHTRPRVQFDVDLITETDLAIQEHIRTEVKEKYPEHSFLDEVEAEDLDEQTPEWLWVVDPLDGTAMFSRGLPVWSISISLFEKGKPVIGVIYLPVTNELYGAVSKGPALLNDRRIEATPSSAVENESLLLSYSRFHTDFQTSFPGKIRSLGSSAAQICYVARGSAVGAVLGNVQLRDISAAQVVLESAGGALFTPDGAKVDSQSYLTKDLGDTVLIATTKNKSRAITRYLQRK